MRARFLLAVIAACLLVAAGSLATERVARQGQPLPIGELTVSQSSDSVPAVFSFNAGSAGFLTVVVRGMGGTDFKIAVTDEVGQPLPDGTSDQDLRGDVGAEQLTVTIPAAGAYQVYVETLMGSGQFNIGAGWIPYPDAAVAPDPDGSPATATALEVGTTLSDSIDYQAGDMWDWFSVTAPNGGMVTVIVEAPEGDLALEVFKEGEFREALNRSDQDLGGVTGNESLTARAEPGETLYFKVTPLSQYGGQIAYSIRAGIM